MDHYIIHYTVRPDNQRLGWCFFCSLVEWLVVTSGIKGEFARSLRLRYAPRTLYWACRSISPNGMFVANYVKLNWEWKISQSHIPLSVRANATTNCHKWHLPRLNRFANLSSVPLWCRRSQRRVLSLSLAWDNLRHLPDFFMVLLARITSNLARHSVSAWSSRCMPLAAGRKGVIGASSAPHSRQVIRT